MTTKFVPVLADCPSRTIPMRTNKIQILCVQVIKQTNRHRTIRLVVWSSSRRCVSVRIARCWLCMNVRERWLRHGVSLKTISPIPPIKKTRQRGSESAQQFTRETPLLRVGAQRQAGTEPGGHAFLLPLLCGLRPVRRGQRDSRCSAVVVGREVARHLAAAVCLRQRCRGVWRSNLMDYLWCLLHAAPDNRGDLATPVPRDPCTLCYISLAGTWVP
jgi:hypothetical protein